MNAPDSLRRRQRATAMIGLILFGLLLFMIQLWLFVAVLENLLAGRTTMAVPAAAASLGLLAINAWMLRGITVLGRRDG